MAQRLRARSSFLVAAAVLLVSLFASVLAPGPRPVYSIDAQLVLQATNATGAGNALRAEASNRIFFAAAIERAYNKTPTDARVASNAATLYGIGVRDGLRVSLPDGGGQWGSNFNRPSLRVEVVSPSQAETRRRFDETVAAIRATAKRLQDDAGVVEQSQVQLELIPGDPGILTIGGSRIKQMVAGILLGVLASAGVYGVLTRRRRFVGREVTA